MARKKRDDIPVKVDGEVIRMARIVAAYEEKTLAEYISERLRPLVQEDLDRHARRVQQVKKAAGRGGPKPGG